MNTPASSAAARLSNTATLRERARRQIEDGPLTQNYGADREVALGLLNAALATEIVCRLRYERH